MKPINNWDKVQAAAERQQLPKGAYVCKIMDAVIKEYESKDKSNKFEKLEISLEIVEGEYKDFFANEYRSQQQEDKRWKGVFRLYVPKDDGSEKDEWTKSRLKAATEAIEESNPGYHWDWNEAGLKGKLCGCIFRSEEWSFNGRTGWSSRPFRLLDAAKVREGDFKLPDDKPLNPSQTPVSAKEVDILVDDDDLPF